MRKQVIILCILTVLVIFVLPSSATLWQAYNSSTLEELMSEANTNDVIYLNPGVYNESINLNVKGLSVIGAGADKVTFDLGGSYLSITAEDCVLKSVSIVNSSEGVEVKAIGCEISKCVFDGLTDNYGIFIEEDSTIFSNNVVSNSTGTFCTVYGYGDQCTYSGNTFVNNSCAGLYIDSGSADNIIRYNVFQKNTCGIKFSSGAGSGNQVYLNDFIDNDANVGGTYSPTWNSPDLVNYSYEGKSLSVYLGNYWNDAIGSDTDGDGIIDSAYTVSSGAGTDSYPLAESFETYVDTSSGSVDLSVESISPVSLVAEQPNRIRVNVSNAGESDSDPFKIILYYDDKPVGEDVIIDLASGSTAQASFTLLPPSGEISLKAVVDAEDVVEETLETNNEMSTTLTSGTVDIDEDWFQFHKDEQHTGYYPGDAPDDSTLLWVSDDITAVGSSSPVVANGTVFINCGTSTGESSSLTGLDMYTGETIGTFGDGCSATSSWVSPCYYEGNVYCARSDSVNGGDLIVNGKRYVGDYSGYTYYCTYVENGTSVWTKSVNGNAICTPAYSDGMVYFTSTVYEHSGDVYCVDADTGKTIWHMSTPSGHDPACAGVTVYNDILYFTTYNWKTKGTDVYGDIYAVDKYDGTVLWRKTIQRTDSCPAVAYGYVYVSGGCPSYSKLQTYCFDAVTGEEIWSTTAAQYYENGIGSWTCSPVVADGMCYVGMGDSTMYSHSAICALDAYSGSTIWSSSGGGASPAISEGILYTVGNNGKVYAYGSLSDTYAEFTSNVTSGTASLTVSFTDQSGTNITSWQWDFDNDGEVDSTEQNPVHVYESAGEYTVFLKVTNHEGNDTEVKEAYIEVTEENDDAWNIWDDSDSDSGVTITTDELQEAIHYWINDIEITDSGDLVTTDRLQELIHEWIES